MGKLLTKPLNVYVYKRFGETTNQKREREKEGNNNNGGSGSSSDETIVRNEAVFQHYRCNARTVFDSSARLYHFASN